MNDTLALFLNERVRTLALRTLPGPKALRVGCARHASRGVALAALVVAASGAAAQPSLNEAERDCAQAVQGKVAWNQSGARQWNPANVAKLCAGVSDVPALIACFQKEVAQHNEWARGIAACTDPAATAPGQPPPLQAPPAAQINLTGKWTQVGPDGGGSGGFGDEVTVRQEGRAFVAEIDAIDWSAPTGTVPKRSTVRGEVRGGSVQFVGPRGIAKLEDSGRIVRFADGSAWVRRGR